MSDQAVQPTAPAEGQDAASQQQPQDDLTGHLLQSASPQFRPEAERLLGEWQKSAQQKFQEAAEYRKQWQPYEELKINEVPQDELSELLQFRQIAQDPDQFRQWHQQIGELLGGDDPEGEPATEEEQGQYAQLSPQDQQQLQELQQWRQQQDEERAVMETAGQIRQQLDSIKKENPAIDDEAENFICTLALQYDDKDAVLKGYEDFKKLVGQAQKGLFAQKADQPDQAVSGGNADVAPQPIRTFADANAAARERLAQSRGV